MKKSYTQNIYDTFTNECISLTSNIEGRQKPYRLKRVKEDRLKRLLKYYIKARR